MRVAALLNVHNNLPLVLDTIESIQAHMTSDILVIKDGILKNKHFPLSVPNIDGFKHGVKSSPFRNVALGLSLLTEYYEADWYCYLEYDCLIGSNRFLTGLTQAAEKNVWMLGAAGRVGSADNISMPLINKLIGTDLSKNIYYLLGCCQFFHRNFINKLKEIDFFNRFLSLTNEFSHGILPAYSGYDLSEHLYPTLVRHFGGNIGVFSTYQEDIEKWHGNYEVYPIRFRPDLNSETEHFLTASILHPLKDLNHPIRQYHREKRKQCSLDNQES